MTRRAKETIGSLLCVMVILVVLVSFDPQVRMKAAAIVDDPVGGALTPFGDKVSDLGGTLFHAVKSQSIENAPLLVFGVVGAVLFIFMLKT
jgi:hypothetical protein